MNIGILIVAGIYVAMMAAVDLRKKEVPVLPGIVCAAVITAMQLLAGRIWLEWLPGAAVGLLIWGAGRVSHGQIGEGDALVYLVLGLALGLAGSAEVLMISLFLAAIAGIGMMFRYRVGRRYAMPFIPFTAAAYGMVMFL